MLSTMTRVFDAKLRLKRGLQKLCAWSAGSDVGPVPQPSPVSGEYFRLLKLKERCVAQHWADPHPNPQHARTVRTHEEDAA